MRKKLFCKFYLLFLLFFAVIGYGQTDSALRYRMASITFEDAVVAHMAMLDTSGNDTSEGGRGNAFTRWYMWADNRRSICPVGEDIFAPLGRELMHYLTTPTGYCAAMSPYAPNWKCIGPYNNYYGAGVQDHAGRINCVWANPNNIAHMRAGANSGGLWETRDTGHTWRCITDRVTTGAYGTQIPGTVAVSAMAVSPLDTNEIHLRLSTIATSGKSNGYDMGIIHSFDGGQHWYHDAVFRSILDPLAFPDFLEGATVGMKFVPGSSKIYSIKNNKIFFNDGTGLWSIKSPGSGTDIKRVTDIEYSRTTPNVALFSADDHDQDLHVYSYNFVTRCSRCSAGHLERIIYSRSLNGILVMSLRYNTTDPTIPFVCRSR